MARRGKVQKKILILLLAGLNLSLTRSPKKHFRIIKQVHGELQNLDKKSLEAAIDSLYRSNLLTQHRNKDSTTTFILSREGKKEALTYNLDTMEIVKHRWDGKWRIIIFDIPENIKKVREALRYHLKNLGFKELQRSVFILPYDCKKEIEYLAEFYNVKRFVRYIEATHIDNELDIKHQFNLI